MTKRRFLTAILFLATFSSAACSEHGSQALEIAESEESITVLSDGRPILVYNSASVEAPYSLDPIYSRSGFIHPVFTPDGQVVTQSFGKSHPHQNGIFMAWTKTQFRGETVDFWNVHKGTGKVLHQRVISSQILQNPNRALIEVELAHKELVGEEHEIVLFETLQITAYPERDGTFIFDVSSKQTLATEEPLILSEYHYGGMGLRLNDSWYGESNEQVEFFTSEGLNRIEGNHSRPKWVAASGTIEEADATIAVLGHPDNFRAPQPVRIHNEIPYFSFSPMVLGEFTIEPDEEYLSRYRYLVSSKMLDHATIDAEWDRFAIQ